MLTCRLTIKVKDYFPKTDSIPFSNYICLFTCGEYQGQIPFQPDDSKFLQHQMKNITSDIKYKVHILDFNDMALIGMCEMTISYRVLNQITPPNGLIQEQQKKLLIDSKTKRKLFGTIINSGDIYLKIYAEVILLSKTNNNELKIKNSKSKKNNINNINTPKCYIKYNFQLNKNDYSPKSSKNNKSTIINGGSEKQTFNISKQDFMSNKHSNNINNNNVINYQRDNEKKKFGNYSNYNSINNLNNKLQQKTNGNNNINNIIKEQNKKNILDLLQQKKLTEEIRHKYNKSDMDENIDDNFDDDNDNDNIYYNKGGYSTEENFNLNKLDNNYFINKTKNNNKKRKSNKINEELELNLNNYNNNGIYEKNSYNYKNNNLNIYTASNNFNDEKQNLYHYSKNTLSPTGPKNIYIEEENCFNNNNINKTTKNNNSLSLQLNNVNYNNNQNFIYSSKNKMVKMGKIYTKRKIKDSNINNNSNNIHKKLNNINNINNNNGIIIPNEFYSNNNNGLNNNNQSESNNNINHTLSNHSEGGGEDDDYLDIDRIILDKGAELRNDFHNQIKYYSIKNNIINTNNHKTLNSLNNNNFNNNTYISPKDEQNSNALASFSNTTNFNSRTPYTEKMFKYSSTQSLNNYLTQEDIKNNCLKLIEFYALLNYKLKKIYPKNNEILSKLNIFKELFSTELKKNNIITHKLNKLNFLYNLTTNINEYKNQKILSLFPKIKKIETNIYQQLFNAFSTQEELEKFNEYENYDKQTKIFLLLNLARNLVKKYGNISQVFTIKNSVNIKKKKILKKCLQNYLIIEKESNDKDFINLENIMNERLNNINKRKGIKNEMDNKFKVIKEVDEDNEEEENEGDEEKDEENINKDIKGENQDQIIDDVDITDNNNNNNNNQAINENDDIEANNDNNEINNDNLNINNNEIKYNIENINIIDESKDNNIGLYQLNYNKEKKIINNNSNEKIQKNNDENNSKIIEMNNKEGNEDDFTQNNKKMTSSNKSNNVNKNINEEEKNNE